MVKSGISIALVVCVAGCASLTKEQAVQSNNWIQKQVLKTSEDNLDTICEHEGILQDLDKIATNIKPTLGANTMCSGTNNTNIQNLISGIQQCQENREYFLERRQCKHHKYRDKHQNGVCKYWGDRVYPTYCTEGVFKESSWLGAQCSTNIDNELDRLKNKFDSYTSLKQTPEFRDYVTSKLSLSKAINVLDSDISDVEFISKFPELICKEKYLEEITQRHCMAGNYTRGCLYNFTEPTPVPVLSSNKEVVIIRQYSWITFPIQYAKFAIYTNQRYYDGQKFDDQGYLYEYTGNYRAPNGQNFPAFKKTNIKHYDIKSINLDF